MMRKQEHSAKIADNRVHATAEAERRHVLLAQQHVDEGREKIRQQELLVAQLERDHQPSGYARDALERLLESQKLLDRELAIALADPTSGALQARITHGNSQHR
jgi:hypothetical protein